jgi:hypothetical protein
MIQPKQQDRDEVNIIHYIFIVNTYIICINNKMNIFKTDLFDESALRQTLLPPNWQHNVFVEGKENNCTCTRHIPQ